MKTNNYELNVIVKGKKIREYEHEGKVFIEGRKDSNFELEFVNKTYSRLLAIPSVDGLNTLEGTPATENSKGYIVEASGTLKVPGWTLNKDNVAHFVFENKKNSYAEISSPTKSQNVGVIGFLVFGEKTTYQYASVNGPTPNYYNPLPWPYNLNIGSPIAKSIGTYQTQNITSNNGYTAQTFGGNSYATSASSVAQTATVVPPMKSEQFSLGAGFGEQTPFATRELAFKRGDRIAELILYYDNRRNLQQRGIVISNHNRDRNRDLPTAFQNVGCTPPPNWKG